MVEEVIKHRGRMGQLKSFRELFIGKYTPSDIDLAYEIGGRVFVFGEIKLSGVEVPTGQRLLLQHIGEALFEAGKNVLLFVAEHDTKPDEVINVGELPVTYMWYTHGGEVRTMEDVNRNVRDVCNQYVRRFIPDL
tara:strand:+ start:212 stop:616 length:405 start_codon:yes stop_codon:yes gene_type:complete